MIQHLPLGTPCCNVVSAERFSGTGGFMWCEVSWVVLEAGLAGGMDINC